MAATTPRAAIVAVRTAIGTARKGTLSNLGALELAKPVVSWRSSGCRSLP
jgi:hypothetical protein